MKKLYRSNDNKIIGGIFGGLGEYFNIDPVLLRLLFIFLTVATGFLPGVIAYLVSFFIVPKAPQIVENSNVSDPS